MRELAIDATIFEIEEHLYEGRSLPVIQLALDLLAKSHGHKAKDEVIKNLELDKRFNGELH